MLFLAETLGQVFLQLAYLIFVKGMLILLNALYQVFNFFTGGNFINHMMGVGSDGTFMIDWNSPIAIIFITSIVAGIVILFLMIGLSFVQNLFSTKEEKTKSFISNKIKYILYFFGAIIGIPIIFIALNMITMILSSILGVNTSLRVDQELINNTKNYLIPILNKIDLINSVSINGSNLNEFLNNLNNELQQNLTNAINTNNQQLIQQIQDSINAVNNVQNNINQLPILKENILNILNEMRVNEINVESSDKLLEYINKLEDIQNSFCFLSDKLNILNKDFSSVISSNLKQYIESFNGSMNDSQIGLGYYFNNDVGIVNIIINGNNDFIGLFNIRSYLSGLKDFDLVLQIYRLATNNPNATNWQANPLYVKVETLAIGIIASLVSVIIVALYTVYVAKRIFIIAIYFVLSPIIIVTGVKDDGYIAANFSRTLMVKFSSIIFITIGMQVAMIITSGNYGLNVLIDQWDTTRILKMTASIILIISGLLAGYTTTGAISKMLGDDSSIMESIQDVMLLTRGVSLAAMPLSLVSKGMMAGVSRGIGKMKTITPITNSQKVNAYSSRIRDLNNLGKNASINDVSSYRNYKNMRKDALGGK